MNRLRFKKTNRQKNPHTNRKINKYQTNRHTNRHTNRQTNRRTNRQMDRQTRQTDKQTNGQTNRRTNFMVSPKPVTCKSMRRESGCSYIGPSPGVLFVCVYLVNKTGLQSVSRPVVKASFWGLLGLFNFPRIKTFGTNFKDLKILSVE